MMEQIDEVKSLLQVNSKKSTGNVRIESDVLEPQQSSQNYATFNLRRAGVLSNDSRLILPLYASNATTRLTMFGGAYSVIKNATLRTSTGVVIAQTTDCNYLASIKNHYNSQEYRDKVGRYKNGTYNVYEYMSSSDGLDFEGKYGVGNMSINGGDRDQHARDKLGTSASNRVEYVLSLRELFPELFPFSLPLFCLEGNVQLFLEFSDNGDTGERAVSSDGNNANIGDVDIDLTNLKFISDHIFFAQPEMDKIMAMTRTSTGLVVPYGDYNEVVFTRTSPSNPSANEKTDKRFQSSIGMAGLRVKHLLLHQQQISTDDKPAGGQKIGGKYCSVSDSAGVDGAMVQVQINNQNYYTQDLPSQEFYKELEDVFGVAPSIPYPLYTTIGGVSDGSFGDGTAKYTTMARVLLSDDTCYANNMRDLLGQSNILGINFCNPLNRANTGANGVQIGNAPVQLTYQRSYTNGKAFDIRQRVFICVERLMSIRNGRIENNYS
jgi:hypothetical protein